VLLEKVRANIVALKLEENGPVMENFRENLRSTFSLLSALPVDLPPLPPQFNFSASMLCELPSEQGEASAGPGSNFAVQAGITYPLHPASRREGAEL